MAMLSIKVPKHISETLYELVRIGDKSYPEEMHITLFCFDGELSINKVLLITNICYEVCQNVKQFMAGSCVVTSFPKNGNSPVIARVISPGLHELRRTLEEKFNKHGVEYSKKFPDFKPHVTLTYTDKLFENIKFDTVKWNVNGLLINAGYGVEDVMTVNIPFNGDFVNR